MWTCPKCGRAFQKQNQGHYCGKPPKTIDEYIAAQPEEVQGYLKKIRDAIHAALPEAEEALQVRIDIVKSSGQDFIEAIISAAGGCLQRKF